MKPVLGQPALRRLTRLFQTFPYTEINQFPEQFLGIG